MGTIDTYGELELPDETSRIEVVEDPVRTVSACYELFKKAISSEFDATWFNNYLKDPIYFIKPFYDKT